MTQAPAAPVKVKIPRDQDPRNPNHRLAAFFDAGSLALISADDDSGMLAAVGTVEGTEVVAFCSDATIQGGAMGSAGCQVVVDAFRTVHEDTLAHRVLKAAQRRGRRLTPTQAGRLLHQRGFAEETIDHIMMMSGANEESVHEESKLPSPFGD